MMEARELLTGEIATYQQVWSQHGSLFADPDWAQCFGSDIKLCGIFNGNNDLIGGFLFSKSDMKGYPYHTNAPFTPSIALFYHNPAENPSNRLGTDKEILDAVARFFRQFRLPIQRFCLPVKVKDMQPFNWLGFKVIPHLTYWIDLQKPETELYANLSAKLRNNIKKAKTDGVVLRQILDYQLCEPMLMSTYSRNKIGVEHEYVRNILFKFAHPGNSFAFGAFKDEEMIAISFFLYDKHTAYYIFGGFNEASKHEGAGAWSIWEGICYAKSKGLTLFDFEGSMIPRIEKYFRGFGGEIANYFTINRAPFLMEVILKLFKRGLF